MIMDVTIASATDAILHRHQEVIMPINEILLWNW